MKKEFIRNEIGSEFWDVPTVETAEHSLFPADTRWFISGTGALEYILDDIRTKTSLKTVGVPSWCCSCMIHPFTAAGIEVVFYPVYVDKDRKLACDYTITANCDATLVLSYFGYTQLKTIGQPGGILIRDLTHALFHQIPGDADYYFGSLRKWAGFWTGGYAWKHQQWQLSTQIPPATDSYLLCRAGAMQQKAAYLLGHSDSKDYLEQFEEAEDFLDRCGIMGSCPRDINLAQNLDVAEIRKQRRENARVLLEGLKEIALFPQIAEEDCPMFVPILLPVQQRDSLRRYLISKQIYCPVHWPISELHVLDEQARDLYERSLSIVCDQRYDAADMRRILCVIEEYYKH